MKFSTECTGILLKLKVLLWFVVILVDILRNRPPQSYTDMAMEMKDDLIGNPFSLDGMDAEPCAMEGPPDIDIQLGDGDASDVDAGAPDAISDPAGNCNVSRVLMVVN